ncbi:unnamed protein product [Mycena citricolor]|uniref:ASTRA-associated protein 1 n=1 Tax=Mycena citricolor TaxID=2018698 RepID=A0AAD2H740_9AGAR|nr:unnamed protein product [Mycena citricolor]
MEAAPAAPTHLVRAHSADVTALFFSGDNERLYSGDASGRVVVTSTRSLRSITSWAAHTDSVLGVEEWGNRIVTSVWVYAFALDLDLTPSARVGGAPGASAPDDVPKPSLCYSMDVNALNYCRFSLLSVSDEDALIALPNLVESSELNKAQADVWRLPARERLHASVGTQRKEHIFSTTGREGMRSGLIMSMHLYRDETRKLCFVCAYEDGSVVLRRFVGTEPSIEGRGWDVVWHQKLHAEAIMAMRVSRDNRIALTVSADHLVGRFELSRDAISPGMIHRTKHAGNACLAIRDDGRVCAVGGWDGRVRLYATKNLKALGTLKYHKSGCQAVEFARSGVSEEPGEEDPEEEEMTGDERQARERWLAVGAKDHRLSLWLLASFEKRP